MYNNMPTYMYRGFFFVDCIYNDDNNDDDTRSSSFYLISLQCIERIAHYIYGTLCLSPFFSPFPPFLDVLAAIGSCFIGVFIIVHCSFCYTKFHDVFSVL